ncbi:TnsA endonuclease N-terminal domain-containing protein [Paenibacillus sp. GCM10023248]|uniref:TnsA endonuclease N-terminal domain-containing protein n=1 Tax=unclassified Paenibacillus TaxID=185978 RepID=UPI002378695F|nr:TnsA endonuclease N-terminal domain-containing protein [Paenibacillus sp. MAHUQ-63]MDD9267871.1 TnsA endonuclease N-terminal domain-containing protein [Paenibacillus sp. MAHUQ-63]
MGRRYARWSLKLYERYLKEGRGQGEGKDYKPWINIHSFSSRGQVVRDYSYTVGRVHHLMSKLERNYFVMLDWDDSVVDIREQYPIIEFDKTVAIAKRLGYKHPMRNKVPIVITSDFCFKKIQEGEAQTVIHTVKPSFDLEDKRVLEKLEIEKLYYTEKGIEWQVITEKNMNKAEIRNLLWIRPAFFIENVRGYDRIQLNRFVEELKEYILTNNLPIRQTTSLFEKNYKTEPGVFMYLFKHLLATKQIRVDLTKPIDFDACLNILNVLD